jgi:tetratricopeptide (TPR) repeat protein
MTYVFFGLLGAVALGGMAALLYWRVPHQAITSRIPGVKLPRARFGIIRTVVKKIRAQKPSELPSRIADDVANRVRRPSFLREDKRKHSLKGIELQALSPSADSEDFWIRLISGDPENPYLYKKLGEFYLRHKQRQHARETFEYAERLAPNDASIKKRLSELK